MSAVMTARIVLALVGFAVFGYGVRSDLTNVRFVGIALLGISLLLRFIERPSRR
jgi:hypothetical protein